MKTIYLDYAATTPIDPRVVEKMYSFLTGDESFGNAASLHHYGLKAKEAIELARAQVAGAIHASPNEIIFTSGATESNNLALKGIAQLYQGKGKHIVTVKTEHKAILDTCHHLEQEGYQVTYLTPEPSGLLSLEKLQSTLRDDTLLVSVMHVNNETGIIQDIESIAKLTHSRQILFHVDAAQSIGKVALDMQNIPVDLLSLSSHKAYGPKGIGALFLRKKPRVRVWPLIHGGGHEQGMRSGTLPTHQIVGMGEAFHIAQQVFEQERAGVLSLRHDFIQGLHSLKHLRFNAPLEQTVPHILNIRFEGMLADAILAAVPIAASTASACQGLGSQGSYVLRSMGLSEEQTKASIRFSFGRMTTREEIEQGHSLLMKAV